MKTLLGCLLAFGCVIGLNVESAIGQQKEDNTVRQATAVFNEVMAIPGSGMSKKMLKNARGIAIIPNVIKGSFVIGARRGNGVLLVRADDGGWHAPVFVNLTGGNIGWQVGIQSTDVVLIFKTQKSIDGLLAGRFTLGVDAAVAAGPIGRQAAAATDSGLGAEIYSYSRSRGLFLGVSFDGSEIRIDRIANGTYYRSPTPGAPVAVPPAAVQLVNTILPYSGMVAPAPAPVAANPTAVPQTPNQIPATTLPPRTQPILAQQHSVDEAADVREQLAKLAPELYELLDTNWQQYLALPAGVFQGTVPPSIESLSNCLGRFDTIKADTRYSALSSRPEFQSTYGLLKHYIAALANTNDTLVLPQPPRIGGLTPESTPR